MHSLDFKAYVASKILDDKLRCFESTRTQGLVKRSTQLHLDPIKFNRAGHTRNDVVEFHFLLFISHTPINA